jgi:hypothetical protein
MQSDAKLHGSCRFGALGFLGYVSAVTAPVSTRCGYVASHRQDIRSSVEYLSLIG